MNKLLANTLVSHALQSELEQEIQKQNRYDSNGETRLRVCYQNHYANPCFSVHVDDLDRAGILFQLNNDGTLELKDDCGFDGDLNYLKARLHKVLGLEI